MWGGETYCKKGRPAQSAVFLYKKGKVWVTRWSTLFPFYKGKQLIFLSEGARRQSYSAAVERFLSPHISSKISGFRIFNFDAKVRHGSESNNSFPQLEEKLKNKTLHLRKMNEHALPPGPLRPAPLIRRLATLDL